MSGKANSQGLNKQEVCCRYGVAGSATMGYDCLIIHGAELVTGVSMLNMMPANMHEPSRFCGHNEGLINAVGSTSTTVCCRIYNS